MRKKIKGIFALLRGIKRGGTEKSGETADIKMDGIILSQDLCVPIDGEKAQDNRNVLVLGGSGAGKSFGYVGPNIMQADCSYVVVDPSGKLYREYGGFLEYMGYRVRCLNLENTKESCHYNPFSYIRSDRDIEMLAAALISSTNPLFRQDCHPLMEKAETAFLTALIAYIWHYTTEDCRNLSSIMKLMKAAETDEEDAGAKSPLDYIFDEVKKQYPESFALKQYEFFKKAAEKNMKAVLTSCAVRFQAFSFPDVADLTDTDDISLDTIGDEKTALFVIIPPGEGTLSFLAAVMCSQFLQTVRDRSENYEFSQLVVDAENSVVRCYRADSPEESELRAEEAARFLARAKNGCVQKNGEFGWYEMVTEDGEFFGYRGSWKEAEKALSLIRGGRVIQGSGQPCRGPKSPVYTRMILDEFAGIGRIPEFSHRIAVSKHVVSISIILQSLAQMQKLYRDDWSDIAGSCDTLIYLGGGADMVTTGWISKQLCREARTVTDIQRGRDRSSASLQRQGIELYTPAQLRTMPEDECVVIRRNIRAYRGKKYMACSHPSWKLAEGLGPYSFSRRKIEFLKNADRWRNGEEGYGSGEEPAGWQDSEEQR